MAIGRIDVDHFKRVLSVSLTSSRQSCSFTKSILHLFPHNMFRRLASCSRGGFDKTDKTSQQTKVVEIFWPQKVKVESKDLWIWFKKLNPSGVSPCWGRSRLGCFTIVLSTSDHFPLLVSLVTTISQTWGVFCIKQKSPCICFEHHFCRFRPKDPDPKRFFLSDVIVLTT